MKILLKKIGKRLIQAMGIILLLIVLYIATHHVLMAIEKNNYMLGEAIRVNDKKMHTFVIGSGEKTIVMLSGLGTASPITDFMPLAERLSSDYKVVILEYFGYGFSDTTSSERSSENIVDEIRSALTLLNLDGPYILMPHSISGIYSLSYAIKYPNEVEAIIGIDASKPNQTITGPSMAMPKELSVLNLLGVYRFIANVDPIMNEKNIYTEEQLKLVKRATAWNSLNRTIINELNHVLPNTQSLYDLKYPRHLPVLSFVSSESIQAIPEWLALHENIISNPALQKNIILEGNHYLHWQNSDVIVEKTKEFVNQHLK